MERRIAAILATDMVGFSRLMEADEIGTLERQKAHLAETIDPKIIAHGGTVIKLTGDGLIAEFPSAVEAVKCAVSFQSDMFDREIDEPEERRISYRVAINLGDVIFDEGDIYGDGVNIAARLEGLAEPGGIVVSGATFDMLKNQVAIGYKFLGEKHLKNIETPVRVYQVIDTPKGSPVILRRPILDMDMIACVIFDMDGTLFDSETLCNRAFLDTIPAITAPLDILVQEFSGRKLAWIFGYIEERFDCVLPSNIEDIYRGRVAELFETDLRAFSGVKEALEGLQVPFCIATSAPITKVQHALGLTGLSDFFVGNIFSSYDIGSWKPEPEIFLHAAREMGHSPPDCLVIEDSQAGIIAANSANMRVVQFCGEAGTPLIEDYFRSYDKFNALLAEN